MRYFTSFFFLVVFLPVSLFAQDEESFKAKFEEGNKLIEEEIYDQALEKFKECVDLQPDNANANYKTGLCYIKADKNKKEALPYLSKAIKDITDRYDPYSHRESSAPPMARYYYGRALHLNMYLDSAITMFEKFRDEVPKRHKLYNDSEHQLEMVEFAQEQVRNRKNVELRNIGEPINTEFHEYSPVISVDENVMYFTSRRPKEEEDEQPKLAKDGLPFEAIFASFRDQDGEWQDPERLDLNRETHHDAVISTSPDGQKLFIYRADKGNGDIYKSRLQGPNEWSEPEPMGSDINTDAFEPHGVLSPDGDEFYFVSDREGGEGGKDIYVAKKLPTGDWGKAQNLGPEVNTPFEEDAPFIHPDGETMYFCSIGHQSMGGYDIFFSEKKDDGSWSEPQNIGFPINTVDDDIFFVTSADGKRGYYASEKEDGFGGRDIYLLQLEHEEAKDLAVMKGFINVPEDEEMPDDVNVKVTNLESGETKKYKPRERDGVFVSILPPCNDYRVEYLVGNEAFKTEQIKVPCEASYQEINKEIFLNPVEMGESKEVEHEADRKRKWKVLEGEKPYEKSGVVVQYVDEDGRIVITEEMKGDGSFPYYELPGEQAHAFQLKTDEPQLCDELELVLVNDKGEEVGRTEQTGRCKFVMEEVPSMEEDVEDDELPEDEKELADDQDADDARPDEDSDRFQVEYDYNQQGLDLDDPEYQSFLGELERKAEDGGSVTLLVTGSASKVPTKSFDSNEKLAEDRASTAVKDLKKHLKSKDIPLSSFEFKKKHRVQGPPYEAGSIRPKAEYLEHQFVRLEIQ